MIKGGTKMDSIIYEDSFKRLQQVIEKHRARSIFDILNIAKEDLEQ